LADFVGTPVNITYQAAANTLGYKRFKHLDKNLLCELGGFKFVPAFAEHKTIYPALMGLNKLLISGYISVTGRFYELSFVIIHFIPASTYIIIYYWEIRKLIRG